MAPRCPTCGARLRPDRVTGLIRCEEGHVLSDYRSENLVVENVAHVLQKRTGKRQNKNNKRREEGRANAQLLHGEEAEWLKLQTLQLMLRLQVKEMRGIWQLPDVFEVIVRELWAYQMAMSPMPAAPGAADASPTAQPEKRANDDKSGEDNEKLDEDDDKSDGSGSEQGSQTEKDEDALDPELLAELSDDTDQSEREGGITRHVEELGTKGERWKRKRRLRVSDTLVTLMTGLWILRIPILLVDIQTLVNDNRLPYLDFAHTTHVPQQMFERMNRDTRIALTPRKAPKVLLLFDEARHFARTLYRHFGIPLPEVNPPPIFWRVISSLGGSPTTYHQVHRLLAIIDANLTLVDTEVLTHTRRARGTRRTRQDTAEQSAREVTYERTTRYHDIILPELSVVAAWVIIMKMAYGLDGTERAAYDDDDPLIGMPQVTQWLTELSTRSSDGDYRKSQKMMEKQDFASMSTAEIDRYLNQCQTVLLDSHKTDTAPPQFPLEPTVDVPAAQSSTWTDYHRTVPLNEPFSPSLDSEAAVPLLPGQKVRSYDAKDVTGELPGDYETVLRAAAASIGVKPYDVGVVVELYERKLEKLRKDRSRSGSRSRTRGVSVGGKKRATA